MENERRNGDGETYGGVVMPPPPAKPQRSHERLSISLCSLFSSLSISLSLSGISRPYASPSPPPFPSASWSSFRGQPVVRTRHHLLHAPSICPPPFPPLHAGVKITLKSLFVPSLVTHAHAHTHTLSCFLLSLSLSLSSSSFALLPPTPPPPLPTPSPLPLPPLPYPPSRARFCCDLMSLYVCCFFCFFSILPSQMSHSPPPPPPRPPPPPAHFPHTHRNGMGKPLPDRTHLAFAPFLSSPPPRWTEFIASLHFPFPFPFLHLTANGNAPPPPTHPHLQQSLQQKKEGQKNPPTKKNTTATCPPSTSAGVELLCSATTKDTRHKIRPSPSFSPFPLSPPHHSVCL